MELTKEWDKTFPKSEKVNHRKVMPPQDFHSILNLPIRIQPANLYDDFPVTACIFHIPITLAADLYEPKGADGKLAAIAVCGPFGAVKEQAAGCFCIISGFFLFS